MSDDPRVQALQRFLEGLRPGLSDHPEMLPTLDAVASRQALTRLLELACSAQHIGNIQLGRGYLVDVPRVWLLDHIQPVAEELLASGDDWEYRRLLELYERLDERLLKELITRGRVSENGEIREAAEDFARKV
jgi:hypothetical protein